jgi:hypothetical protein
MLDNSQETRLRQLLKTAHKIVKSKYTGNRKEWFQFMDEMKISIGCSDSEIFRSAYEPIKDNDIRILCADRHSIARFQKLCEFIIDFK